MAGVYSDRGRASARRAAGMLIGLGDGAAGPLRRALGAGKLARLMPRLDMRGIRPQTGDPSRDRLPALVPAAKRGWWR